MLVMAKKRPDNDFDTYVNVRCLAEARRALKRLVADLEADRRLRFRGKAVTQDAVIMAGWLWMEELGSEKVAELIGRYLAQMDRIVASRKARAELGEGSRDLREENLDHVPPPPLEGERPREQKRPKPKGSPSRRD